MGFVLRNQRRTSHHKIASIEFESVLGSVQECVRKGLVVALQVVRVFASQGTNDAVQGTVFIDLYKTSTAQVRD